MANPKPIPKVERLELLFGSWDTVDRHWNLVIVPDGYVRVELDDPGPVAAPFNFKMHAAQVKERLVKEPPFDRMRGTLNIFRMDVASPGSWNSTIIEDWYVKQANAAEAEPDPEKKRQIIREAYCKMPPTNTAFASRFCRDSTPRVLHGDYDLAERVARSDPLLRKVDAILVIVNTTRFMGGAGGRVAWTSRYGDWLDTAVHELGHQAFNLEDEYHFESVQSEHARYTGAVFGALNVTTRTHPNFPPWAQLLTPSVPLPTSTPNTGCAALTTAAQIANGTFGIAPGHADSIGAFEGAARRLCGIYRPALNCRMRRHEQPFCAVCEQIIVEALGRHLFGNARTRPERPIDRASHVLSFLPSKPDAEMHFLAYDFASGAYAIYPCRPFVEGLLTPSPYRGTIAALWTSLTLIMVNGEPHILAVQLGSGLTALYKFAYDGSALTQVWGGDPGGLGVPFPFGTLQVVPFTYNGEAHYLEYDIGGGTAIIKRIDLSAAAPITVRSVPWGIGNIGFAPFTLASDLRAHFVSYNVMTGTIGLDRFDGDDVTSVWGSGSVLTPGWTDLVPFRLADESRYLLLHSRMSGLLRMFRVRNDGQGIDYVYTENVGRGPFTFAPFTLNDGQRYYLRYRWAALPGQPGSVAAFHCG